jgi:hypothetical protein
MRIARQHALALGVVLGDARLWAAILDSMGRNSLVPDFAMGHRTWFDCTRRFGCRKYCIARLLHGKHRRTAMIFGKEHRIIWLATGCLAAFALAALVIDHWAHALGVLPYLLLLACPLMHLIHKGHRGHSVGPLLNHGQPSKLRPDALGKETDK